MKKFILLSLIVIGCHGADIMKSTNVSYAPTTNIDVIFQDHVDTSFVEIGLVEASGGWSVSHETLLEDMIEEAKQAGADAIYNIKFGDIPHQNQMLGSITKPNASAIMIKYE